MWLDDLQRDVLYALRTALQRVRVYGVAILTMAWAYVDTRFSSPSTR